MFPQQIIQYHSNPSTDAKEAEVDWFYEDLQHLVLTPKRDVLFIIGDWNAKVEGKLGLEVRNEARQRLIEFGQENTLVIADTPFQQHKRQL